MPSEEDSELWSTRSAAESQLATLAEHDPDEVRERAVLEAALKEQERSAQHRRSAHEEMVQCADAAWITYARVAKREARSVEMRRQEAAAAAAAKQLREERREADERLRTQQHERQRRMRQIFGHSPVVGAPAPPSPPSLSPRPRSRGSSMSPRSAAIAGLDTWRGVVIRDEPNEHSVSQPNTPRSRTPSPLVIESRSTAGRPHTAPSPIRLATPLSSPKQLAASPAVGASFGAKPGHTPGLPPPGPQHGSSESSPGAIMLSALQAARVVAPLAGLATPGTVRRPSSPRARAPSVSPLASPVRG